VPGTRSTSVKGTVFLLVASRFALPSLWVCSLGALSILLLISGLDDCIPLCICLFSEIKTGLRKLAGKTDLQAEAKVTGERRIAIFVPCWRESAVIGNMVRHNLAAIRYQNFDFFLGVYPNDPDTITVAARLGREFHNVHIARCPDPGPTSKADCLNRIYERMELVEDESGVSFDTVVLHDAEDLIHPQALALINRERARFEMVQVPVLPLKTGVGDVTHGVYCDEFSEFQMIDMRARELSRSFIPSNGVGTGFAREVLDRLARERNYQVFDVASLTEDYAIGVHIHAMGYRQHFAPLHRGKQDFVATREFFPRTMRTAICQRTRWVTGIALQCWERQGWRGPWRTKYWFWRDRKGVITNPLSVVANVLFIAGILDYLVGLLLRWPWHFAVDNATVASLCALTMVLQCFRLSVRAICVARLFGASAALAVPLRSFHANLINCSAAVRALQDYFTARRHKRALAWKKTEHAYPAREVLHTHRRELVDILIGSGALSDEQLARIQPELSAGSTLDLLLLAKGLISEEALCRALSLQSGLPTARLESHELKTQVVRNLPRHVERRYRVVPFDVKFGKMLVASAAVPSADAFEEIGKLTELPLEVQLVTQSTYQRLRELLAAD
jgi:bacteriophage N4 adsorption protein B